MAAMSARERLERPSEPRRTVLDRAFAGIPAGSVLHVSTPRLLDAYVRGVPSGTVMTVAELRDALARLHEADATCPVTTAMFLRVIAEVALDDLRDGTPVEEVTPFWRVVDPASPIASRVTGARELIVERRRAEGAQEYA